MNDKKQVKENIKKLIEKYELSKKSFLISKYSEEETKKDFILPLFASLGWDVTNKNEVSAEESQSSGRVDYGFYLDGRIKFYLEAKSLKTDLHKEEFANQAVRYSWNKGVTWAVLTDFESLIVFNAQDISKNLGDKRFFEIPYFQYIERFDQLWLLSKDAFEQNLIDKEAEKYGKKLQRISVGALLYKDLNECRRLLTHDLSAWNEKVPKGLLDEGVQKILDRLIFIRVAEDRGIEQPILIPLIREWENRPDRNKVPLYKSMISKFRELDTVYNSNLFSPHPFENWDEYSGVTNKVVDILYGKKGYYEYDFQLIPADILGSVYENYLGYKLTQSKKGMTVHEDAGKRKEQGIYYTPDYIVDYIVNNALKPILDKCTSINDLKKIKVLDPACGSGSFLMKALEVIYEKYLEFGNRGGVLTKLEILLNNIYGVDLDQQAVEIARLNLLINTLDKRMNLPPLDKNIKNGNSLISGSDEELTKYFGKNFKDKKPFNWQEEFPEVFKQGGFDVIVGNPPYIRVDSLDAADKIFWKEVFKTNTGKYDLYYLFIERSISLLKKDGVLGFIVPNKFCVSDSGIDLRILILQSSAHLQFISVSKMNIFQDASNYPIILLLTHGKNLKRVNLGIAKEEDELLNGKFIKYSLSNINLKILPANIIPINAEEYELELVLNIIHDKERLNEYLKISEGLRLPTSFETLNEGKLKIVKQYQFSRYSNIKKGSFICEDNLTKMLHKTAKRYVNIFTNKIIFAEDALNITATLDLNEHIPQGGVYFGSLINKSISLMYLLGLLNSKLLSFVYRILFSGMHMGGGYLRFRTTFLGHLPIVLANSKHKREIIVNLVDTLLKLHNEIDSITENSNKWDTIKNEIEKTDEKINQEVYKLYGLTQKEIALVEGINSKKYEHRK